MVAQLLDLSQEVYLLVLFKFFHFQALLILQTFIFKSLPFKGVGADCSLNYVLLFSALLSLQASF